MPATTDPNLLHRLTRPVHTYGCVLCQAYHTEGDDLYAPHLHRAAKHHDTYRPATPTDVLRRTAGEPHRAD